MKFNMDVSRTQILSYGGGVNSVAVLVLVKRGALPKPEYIVIADTGREASSTWEYLDEVIQPYVSDIGLRVEVAPHELSTVDLYGHNGDLLLPMYISSGGKLPGFCSSEWKMQVVRRWLRKQGVNQCDLWIGYSADEILRVKPSNVKWQRRVFPLVDLYLTRRDCLNLIEDEGLPIPPHSSCWMCPNRTNEEWRYLQDNYPGDFRKAIQLEKQVRQLDNNIWLHRDCMPLHRVDLSADNGREYLQCGLGVCFV